ncbi:MBL fold metallo-hydrolase [Streptomyces amakusaensis]|uniref:MBL fold metallo-hydrolase n=1 Tax=Streptomyces amakusaensis TaxID=67271 RepID=A0ABW0A9A0_9ACTN
MLVLGFPAGSFETNAYVIAPGPGSGCLIIDPGQRSADGLHELITRHRLEPEAVLITHGHMDHTWDAVPVSRRYGVPVHIHPQDRFMLAAPARGLPANFPGELLEGHPCAEPADVRLFGTGEEGGSGDGSGSRDGESLVAAGLTVSAHHVGGHTPGSVVFHCAYEGESVLFTGDALFAGALGRTDGPGGDARALRNSLARVCGPMADATALCTGHGGTSTLGRERRVHAFL